MTDQHPGTGLQIRSTIKKEGKVELTLVRVETSPPKDSEVIIRMEAAPINPSDLGLLFGPADINTVRVSGTEDHPVITADVQEKFITVATEARIGESMPAGNEGAGIVVEAGASDAAQALIGKTVAIMGGPTYTQFRCVEAEQCLVLPEGTTPAEAASSYVNPLTVLGMLGTMRMENHKAIVHTAAASNLGQMLVKLCKEEYVELVNIVRKQEHVELLKSLGARYICNSSSPDFTNELTEALVATGATLAFDAIGGGTLASQILNCMEVAASKRITGYRGYGSAVHKQVYIYGGLDRSPTELHRNFGMAWGVGGWLLPYFLEKIGPDATRELKNRVAVGIKTTFASSYTKVVSLSEALQMDAIAVYGKQATGEKYLINPNK